MKKVFLLIILMVGFILAGCGKQVIKSGNDQLAENTDIPGWQTYQSKELGFEVKYPNNWVLVESPSEKFKENGIVAKFSSSDTEKLINERKLHPSMSNNLVISYWKDINNNYAKGGSWTGEWEYANLDDFFTDERSLKQKIGEINLDGQKAYEVIIGGSGSSYGIMFERGGVYELSFNRIEEKSKLTDIEKEVISTFKFIN